MWVGSDAEFPQGPVGDDWLRSGPSSETERQCWVSMAEPGRRAGGQFSRKVLRWAWHVEGTSSRTRWLQWGAQGRGGGDAVRGALGASLCEVRGHWKDLAFILSQTGAKGEFEVGDHCALTGSPWSCVQKRLQGGQGQ